MSCPSIRTCLHRGRQAHKCRRHAHPTRLYQRQILRLPLRNRPRNLGRIHLKRPHISDTSIDSLTVRISSFKSTRLRLSTVSVMPFRSNLLNPGLVTRTEYAPGVSAGTRHSPSAVLATSRRFGGLVNVLQHHFNLSAERSLRSYDVPNAFVANYVYPLPLGKTDGWTAVLGDLTVSGVHRYQVGIRCGFR